MATTRMPPPISDPQAIAQIGEKIYNERYKAQYEAEYLGKFVAINVKNGHATLAATSEEALEGAKKANPNGLFHLIKVGSAGAFRVSYALNADNNRIHR